MRSVLLSILLILVSVGSVKATNDIDSLKTAFDSLDKIHAKLEAKSQEVAEGIDAAQKKIDTAKNHKPNYWMPIIGGAILGIGLAIWLRRKK